MQVLSCYDYTTFNEKKEVGYLHQVETFNR